METWNRAITSAWFWVSKISLLLENGSPNDILRIRTYGVVCSYPRLTHFFYVIFYKRDRNTQLLIPRYLYTRHQELPPHQPTRISKTTRLKKKIPFIHSKFIEGSVETIHPPWSSSVYFDHIYNIKNKEGIGLPPP